MSIKSASQHREKLLECIEKVCDGRLPVSHANAVVGLSGEFHKSIRQEWEMRCYAAENAIVGQRKKNHILLGHEDIE